MSYTEIVIVAPSTASSGSVVNFEVKIQNLQDYIIYVIPVIDVNGGRTEGSYEAIVPEETHSWSFQFTMPGEAVTITAESWCEDTFEWQKDAIATEAIGFSTFLSSVLPLIGLVLIAGLMVPMVKDMLKK